jgi:hypothetical protein
MTAATITPTTNWATVWLIPKPGGKPRRVTGEQADLARFLATQAH